MCGGAQVQLTKETAVCTDHAVQNIAQRAIGTDSTAQHPTQITQAEGTDAHC